MLKPLVIFCLFKLFQVPSDLEISSDSAGILVFSFLLDKMSVGDNQCFLGVVNKVKRVLIYGPFL